MPRALTDKEFKKLIKDLYGNEFKILTPYQSMNRRILVRHNIKECMQERLVTPNTLKRFGGCPACGRKNNSKGRKNKRSSEQKPNTPEWFEEQVKILENGDYEVITPYEKASKKVVLKHKICEKEYEVRPHNFINNNSRCPYCHEEQRAEKMNQRKNNYDITFNDIMGDEYQLLNKFEGPDTILNILHLRCNQTSSVKYKTFVVQNSRKKWECPYCKEKELWRKKHEQFIERVKDLFGNEYTVVGQFKGSDKKIRVRHNVCNEEYEVKASSILEGHGCYNCSKGKRRNYVKQN